MQVYNYKINVASNSIMRICSVLILNFFYIYEYEYIEYDYFMLRYFANHLK